MTPPAPTLTPVGGLPPDTWLYLLSSSADTGIKEYWAGYRAGADLGSAPTLDQVWQDTGGTYVFLATKPPDRLMPAFAAQLDALRASTGNLRIAWIANPSEAAGTWRSSLLRASATGSGAGIAWALTLGAEHDLGDYTVELAAGSALTQADPASVGYGIAIDAAGFGFASPHGGATASAGTAWLPLAGASTGAWRARLRWDAGAMAKLGVLVRYGAPAGDGAPGDDVQILDAAPLGAAADGFDLHLAFDPLYPLAPGRTRLGFLADGGTGTPPRLAATFRTSRGYRTTLTARAAAAPLGSGALAFGRTPLYVPEDWAAASWVYHLTPAGAFDLAVVPYARGDGENGDGREGGDELHRLMPGLSGLEYVALPPATGGVAYFAPGGPAYAPFAGPGAPLAPAGAAPLSALASTAYVTFLPAAPNGSGLSYYAQPQQAPLYSGASAIGTGFMDFHQFPAASLPGWPASGGAAPATFPSVPFAGTAPGDAELARRLEHAALAPARRAAITQPSSATGNEVTAVTPQGLLADVSDAGFGRVVLANMPATEERQLDLVLRQGDARLGAKLQGALQSNELFFVVANPTELSAESSVRFRIGPAALRAAAARGVPAEVIAAVEAILDPAGYPNEQALRAAIADKAGEYVDDFVAVGGFLKATMSGWTFQLSPPAWREPEPAPPGPAGPAGSAGPADPGSPTVMLVKYASRPLEALVDDTAAWPWPKAGALKGRDVSATRKMVAEIFAHARGRAEDPAVPADDPYAAFHRDVVANRSWNGILFLNAPVAIDELPAELEFLTTGIVAANFYAHHVGFSATPVKVGDGGALVLGQTAAFGLIDYQDPYDLVMKETVPFGFKTLALTARFANAALNGFSARCELLTNVLFGVGLTKIEPEHGNNLVLDGSYQDHDGQPSYAFALEGMNRYTTTRSALESVEVAGVGVMTTAPRSATGALVTSFVMTGDLRFIDLPQFDPFCYGGVRAPDGTLDDGRLRFDGLTVRMSATPGKPTTFDLLLEPLRFDLTNSTARPRSLTRNFPVRLTGLLAASSQKPADLDYVAISAPLDQSPLEPPWFGLEYTLDLGSLGALSGGKSLTLTLVAAWGPGERDGDYPVYLGIKLPGGRSGGTQWPLQGVMKLGFRSFQFLVGDDGPRRAHTLRLRRFALSVLGLSLPPGNLDLLLVGDPRAAADAETDVVAWYAAYKGA
jgi:hypothetical protein